MGLTALLASSATRSAHVLVVETPGAWETRVRLEQALAARGWRPADSPADADVLAVCGRPGPELAGRVEQVWAQLPGPRARVAVTDPDQVVPCLDRAAAELRDTPAQREDARARPTSPEVQEDHGDMEMAPDGIPLAGGGEDRDGLEMDQLHVRLGPILPHWPPGLVLRCTLQGDLVAGAEVSVLDPDGTDPDAVRPPTDHPARRVDAAAQVLALAGWEDAAAEARRVRDRLLADPAAAPGALDRLHRRVARSRLLRWSLRDLGRVTDEDAERLGLPAELLGDVRDRLLALLGPDPGTGNRPLDRSAVAALVTGVDLAAARLVLASLDLGTSVTAGAQHG